jgi:hypothetical protein
MIVFAVISTTVLVFCCVPMVALQIAFGPEETRDSAAVEAVARRIAPMVIPAKFQGTVARTADNSMLDVRVVRFDQSEGRGRLVVGRLHMKPIPPPNEYDVNLLQQVVDQLFPGLRLLDAKPSQRVVKIDGQDVTFEILDGEDRASTTRLKQVSGVFNGPSGAFQLLFQAESDFVTDDAIEALLQSLAAPPGDATKTDP